MIIPENVQEAIYGLDAIALNHRLGELIADNWRTVRRAILAMSTGISQLDQSEVIGAFFAWEEMQDGVITNCEAFKAGATYAAATLAKGEGK